MRKKTVMVAGQFHCDVVWRRPPEVQTAIRDRQFTSALDMLAKCPEFRFEFDQAAIVREYLEAHPERLEAMRQFIDEGRLDITGGEEAIPDTNMVTGEGFVRNFLLGRLWFEDTLGVRPVVANLDDAFGMTPQLPQIFLGLGFRYFRAGRTPGLDPELARKGIRWEGLDGSRLFCLSSHAGIETTQHVCNVPVVYTPAERARYSLGQAMAVDLPVVYCGYCSEEGLVADEDVRLVLEMPRPRGTEMRFATVREIFEATRHWERTAPVVRGEFNPSEAATTITRIPLKLAYRQAEWAAITAEAAAACAALQGRAYPHARLTDAWRKLAYVQFHDALCGCHIDPVNRRLMGYCRQVSRTAQTVGDRSLKAMAPRRGRKAGVVVFNPLLASRQETLEADLPAGTSLAGPDGKPLPAERRGNRTAVLVDLPPMSTSCLHRVKAPAPKPQQRRGAAVHGRGFRVGPYRVTARHEGVAIEHVAWRRRLVSGSLPQVRFRHDDGTLWTEHFQGRMFTDESGTQKLVRREDGPLTVRLVWEGEVRGDPAADPAVPDWFAPDGKPPVFSDLKRLTWEKELVFHRHCARIDATVRIDFRGKNTEILIGFPLELDLSRSRAVYEVPFGATRRRPYFEVPAASPEREGAPHHLADFSGRGAWPALGWVAYGDHRWGMLLANRGTPSHRLMNGMIEVGVLRSPTAGTSFTVPESAHENGRHTFEFALAPFRQDHRRGRVYELGARFNAPPLVCAAKLPDTLDPPRSLCELTARGVAFSALKRAERADGFVLRSFETEGRPAKGRLRTAFPLAAVHEVNLLEEPAGEVDPKRLSWRPFEIKSLLLVPGDA